MRTILTRKKSHWVKVNDRYSLFLCKCKIYTYLPFSCFQLNRGSERCRLTVSLPARNSRTISLIFDNLTIPVGERLLVWRTTAVDLKPWNGNPNAVFTPADNGKLYYVGPDYEEAVILEFNSITQFQVRFQDDRGSVMCKNVRREFQFAAITVKTYLPRHVNDPCLASFVCVVLCLKSDIFYQKFFCDEIYMSLSLELQ